MFLRFIIGFQKLAQANWGLGAGDALMLCTHFDWKTCYEDLTFVCACAHVHVCMLGHL